MNIWTDSADDWSEYHAHRPRYPDSIYEQAFSYHAKQKGNGWEHCCDLGCGGGIVGRRLTSRFTHVVFVDPMDEHLEAVSRQLKDAAEINSDNDLARTNPEMIDLAQRVSFVQSKAEDLASKLPPASLDYVGMAEAMHWTDTPRALNAIAAVLKPGGTLAVWWYGPMPRILDNPEADEALGAIYKIWKPMTVPKLKSPLPIRIGNSRLRCLRFEPTLWEAGVQRHEWMCDGPEIGGGDSGAEASAVAAEDIVTEHTSPPPMVADGDTGWIKGYLHSLWKDHDLDGTAALREAFQRLERLLAGDRARLAWPTVVVLATRRRN